MPKSDTTRQARRHPELTPGSPGYRTRPGATGLDPMDSYLEEGRMIGIGLHSALRMRVRSWPAVLIQALAGASCLYASASLLPYYLSFRPIPLAFIAALLSLGIALITNSVVNGRRLFRRWWRVRQDSRFEH